MSWSLLPLSGSHRGESIPLRSLPMTIGRDAKCQLKAKSPLVAQKYCTLYVSEGLLAVEDHGSQEGTYLDGLPVLSPTYISAATVLQVGPMFLKFCWQDDESSVQLPVEDQAAAVLAGTV
ncbi:hypothetical protein BH11PLA2_BH11PLA2_31740 [soil metagenome]